MLEARTVSAEGCSTTTSGGVRSPSACDVCGPTQDRIRRWPAGFTSAPSPPLTMATTSTSRQPAHDLERHRPNRTAAARPADPPGLDRCRSRCSTRWPRRSGVDAPWAAAKASEYDGRPWRTGSTRTRCCELSQAGAGGDTADLRRRARELSLPSRSSTSLPRATSKPRHFERTSTPGAERSSQDARRTQRLAKKSRAG